MSEGQAANIIGIIGGALFVIFNGPLGEVTRRWSRYTMKGSEGASALPHRVGFVLLGLFFIFVGIVNF